MTILLSAIHNPQSAIDIEGSFAWQMVILSLATCLILFEVIRGWRFGVMRQLVRVVAVVAGYATAYFGGGLLVPLLRSSLQVPDIMISLLGGAILAVAVYGIISGVGRILFKPTARQGSGAARLAYGLGGALLGFCFGAFFVWVILAGIRTIGSIAEAQVQARQKADSTQNPNLRSSGSSNPSTANLDADAVTSVLARVKNSIEMGPVGEAVKKHSDVLPSGVYQTLGEAGTVLSNPESAQRFLNFPGVRELSENPKIVALRNDPEIAEMAAQGRVLDLLRDPRVLDAINDPALLQQMKQFDMKGALEHAKEKKSGSH